MPARSPRRHIAERLYRQRRYRRDPIYRAKIIEAVKKREEPKKANPLYRELTNLRKKISDKRGVLDRGLAKVEAWEKELIALIARRDAVKERLAKNL